MADAEQNKGQYHLPEEFLSDDFFTKVDEEDLKTSIMGTSPQSTPCGIGNYLLSSNGSLNGPSQAPLSTPFPQPRDHALDLLYAATVGRVERLNLNGENPSRNRNNLGNFYLNQELVKQQLQAARFYQLKRQQLMKMQQYANAVWEQQRQSRADALRLSPSEWPPLQKLGQQPGSGITAASLKRMPSNGTGVFLPRRIRAPAELRKKQTCSTVLVPERVVQALNLKAEEMGVSRLRMPDGLMGHVNLKKRNHRRRQAVALGTKPEICLPQELTY